MVRKHIVPMLALTFFSHICLPAQTRAYYEESLSRGSGGQEVEILDGGAVLDTGKVSERPLDISPQSSRHSIAESSPAILQEPVPATQVTQIGSGRPVAVSGRATGLPLNIAIPMLLPKGWKVDFNPEARDRRVTFNFNKRPWVQALEDMSRSTGTPIVVNWRQGTVLVGKTSTAELGTNSPSTETKGGIVRKAVISKPGRADEVALRYRLNVKNFCNWNNFGPAAWLASGYEVYIEEPPAGTQVVANIQHGPGDPFKNSSPSTTPTAGKAVQAQTPEMVPVSANVLPFPETKQSGFVFALGPGPLSRQLTEWCNRAGYQLVWNVGDDYDITSHSAFGEDFKRALQDLFNSLMVAGHPLRATVYERNHIVEVTGE